MIIAEPGERVMDCVTSKVICRVRVPLHSHGMASALDFYEFAEDETPWRQHEIVDERCVRRNPDGKGTLQLFVEGEWRP